MYDPGAAQAIDLNADTVMMWNAYVSVRFDALSDRRR
jgi:hypothetical protein